MLSNNAIGLTSGVFTTVLAMIIMFTLWVVSSILRSREKQRIEREISQVVLGNVGDSSRYNMVVRYGENLDVARVQYDFEKGQSSVECTKQCQSSSGQAVRFKYFAPDFKEGRVRREYTKTCMCEGMPGLDENSIQGRDARIAYLSSDRDIEAYNGSKGEDTKGIFRDIAAKHGYKLV